MVSGNLAFAGAGGLALNGKMAPVLVLIAKTNAIISELGQVQRDGADAS